MTPSPLVDRFVAFVVAERERYEGDDNNRVAFSLGQVGRYLRFVEIAKFRYQAVNEEVVGRFRREIDKAAANPGTRELTAEEVAEFETGSRLHLLLHFEIESFILFAKTLLDKIAHCIEDLYGPARG